MRLVNRDFPRLQRRDPRAIVVRRDHVMPRFGQATPRHEAHIPASNHSKFHAQSPFSSRPIHSFANDKFIFTYSLAQRKMISPEFPFGNTWLGLREGKAPNHQGIDAGAKIASHRIAWRNYQRLSK